MSQTYHKYRSIHLFSEVLILYRVAGNPESIPGHSGHKPGEALNRMQATIIHTHLQTMENVDMTLILPHMTLDLGEETSIQRKTPKANGEHVNSTHAEQGWETNPYSPGGARLGHTWISKASETLMFLIE